MVLVNGIDLHSGFGAGFEERVVSVCTGAKKENGTELAAGYCRLEQGGVLADIYGLEAFEHIRRQAEEYAFRIVLDIGADNESQFLPSCFAFLVPYLHLLLQQGIAGSRINELPLDIEEVAVERVRFVNFLLPVRADVAVTAQLETGALGCHESVAPAAHTFAGNGYESTALTAVGIIGIMAKLGGKCAKPVGKGSGSKYHYMGVCFVITLYDRQKILMDKQLLYCIVLTANKVRLEVRGTCRLFEFEYDIHRGIAFKRYVTVCPYSIFLADKFKNVIAGKTSGVVSLFAGFSENVYQRGLAGAGAFQVGAHIPVALIQIKPFYKPVVLKFEFQLRAQSLDIPGSHYGYVSGIT